MRLYEFFLDKIADTKLFEMAFERKVAIQKARNLQHQISRHIIKTVMYSKSQYVNHWCNEINGWLTDISDTTLKRTRRPLDSDTLMNILFEEPMASPSEVKRKMNKIYGEYPDLKIDEPDEQIVHRKIYDIMKNISDDIANDKFNDIRKYIL
jgi:hypothetical protein